MIRMLARIAAGRAWRARCSRDSVVSAFLSLTFAIVSTASAETATVGNSADVREWNFRVLLDEKEIGYHRFRLQQDGASRVLESNARFDVRFLFITAYKYRHLNRETWNGSCLAQIEADTDANGTSVSISGERVEDRFVVDDGAGVTELPECVMSFAYWNPRILEQAQLLNAQTGELVDITIEAAADDVLDVRGLDTPAKRYRLSGEDLQIDVWYSLDNEWLALESPAKGGRTLRYVLT